MTPGPGRGWQAILRGARPGSALAEFGLRFFGGAAYRFEPLILRFASAEKHVLRLERTLASGLKTGADASMGKAWDSLERLYKLAAKLAGPEQEAVLLELDRCSSALLARDAQKYEGLFDRKAVDSIRKLNQSKRATGIAGRRVAKAVAGEIKAADVMAGIDGVIHSEMVALWAHVKGVVRQMPKGLDKFLDEIAATAKPVGALMKAGAAKGSEELWGYVSRARGLLGEVYALANKVWLALRDRELARAEALAARLDELLGPGHEVHYLTQIENGLKLNGLEGPDAVIVILNRRTGEIFDPMRAQVKTAAESQSIVQSIQDQARSAGLEKKVGPWRPYYEFQLTKGGRVERFNISWHPEVRTHNIVINAVGSRLPGPDVTALRALGMSVTELRLDVSVEQFTDLTVSFYKAALKAAERAQ